MPEAQLQHLIAASRDNVAVEALVTGRKEPLLGKLNFVDNTVDPTIGTVRAKAVFPNADQSLWPGQFVETRVTVRTIAGATVVPAAALLTLAEGTAMYVVDAEGAAKLRKVQVLNTFGTQLAVKGVEPGERVVVEGKQNVRPGGKVRVEKPAPTKGSGPADASVAPASDGPARPR